MLLIVCIKLEAASFLRVVRNPNGSIRTETWGMNGSGSADIINYNSVSDISFASPALTNIIAGWSSNLSSADYWLNSDGTINRANVFSYNTDQNTILPGSTMAVPSVARTSAGELLSQAQQQFSGGVYYYVSSVSGSDANPGTSSALPWKSIIPVTNTLYNPGDTILFKRGEVFYGQLSLKGTGKSGTTNNPITFGAYGIGVNPQITGFSNITSWVNTGGNIWESSTGVTPLTTLNAVMVNSSNTARGRWPKVTADPHYRFDVTTNATSGSLLTNSIVCYQLTNSTYSPPTIVWTNAEVVIWDADYTIDKHPVTNQVGGIVYFTGGDRKLDEADGLFMQEDLRCLTAQNEWMWNSSTKKISIYSTYSPTNVQAASQNYNFTLDGNSNIVCNGIDFTGANGFLTSGSSFGGIDLNSTHNIQLLNCGIRNQGHIGIRSHNNRNSNIRIENCLFDNCNQMGAILSQTVGPVPQSTNAVIRFSKFTNMGMLPGMFVEGLTTSMTADGPGTSIEYNEFYNTGGFTIHWWGSGTRIANNVITNFCMTTRDSGSMYTFNTTGVPTNTYGIVICDNIIAHGGHAGTSRSLKHGIYFDWRGNGTTVERNHVWDCGYGIYHHVTTNIIIRNNNVFNCQRGGYEGNASETWTGAITTTNNIFTAWGLGAGFASLRIEYDSDIIPSSNVYNYNCYAGVTNSGKLMNHTGVSGEETVAQWKVAIPGDISSFSTPLSVTASSTAVFKYNQSPTNQIQELEAGTWYDYLTNSYTGTISLPSFSSKTLWKP